MDIIAGILAGEGFVPLIPVWFYLFSSLAYGAAAAISALVSYFSFRIFMTDARLKSNMFLSLGFAGMALAFIVLAFTGAYTYLHDPYLQGFLGLNIVNTRGYMIYYVISILSYVLMNVAYLPKKFMKKIAVAPVLFVPLWYISSGLFHIVSIALLIFVNARTIKNFLKSWSLSSFLVMACFAAMMAFHILLYLISFDITFYLLAHAILAGGFASLLVALIRVKRHAEEKK